MSRESLLQKIKDGALVVDVRSPEEFSAGHYPNARNIPANGIMNHLDDFGAKDSPIIVYCESGSRSEYAALILRASGFRDVTNAGGLDEMPRS